MTDIQVLIRIAKSTAISHAIDPSLVCAVCDHETGGTWDQYASRFEPAFYERYIVPMKDIPTDSLRSTTTEAYQRAMSWGLMQIMGQTARELGYADRFLAGLCEPIVGVEYGCRKLDNCLLTTKTKAGVIMVSKALLAYNGGSNSDYPFQVMGLMEKYQ